MPRLDLGSHVCHYRLDGRDDAPVLVLSHALGLDLGMWDVQAALLARHVRVLRYDTRGHGGSDTASGDANVAGLGADVIALVDALGIDRFAFCGVSLGGMVGQWLGAHHRDRLTHLVLANTSPRVADPAAMEDRRRVVLADGMAAVVDRVLDRFFSSAFRRRQPATVAWARGTLRATDAAGYAACCAAVRDHDGAPWLSRITTPTLVIGGSVDVSMPWDVHGRVLAAGIPEARHRLLSTGHLSNLEAPAGFLAALTDVLLPRPADALDAGLAVRRATLGEAYVDRALASTTEFTREFQQLITTYAWGTIWTRPGLETKTRRLLVLAMTAALGRWEEFRLHLRAGLESELEPEDVEEVLLQVAVYAGVPAANTGFHVAREILGARGAAAGDDT